MSERMTAQTARISALLLGALLATAAAGARAETGFDPIELSTSPVQLNSDDPQQDRVGRLMWRGGLEIASDDDRFGGLSGLLVSADGTELLAVSDRGRWFSARLDYDRDGRLEGLGEGKVARLRDPDGEVLKRKKWRDAESMAAFEDGTTLVGFEGKHRVWLYDAPDGKPTVGPQPQGLKDIPKNSGLEALVALPNRGLLALAQDRAEAPNGKAFLWRENRWWPLTYDLQDEFQPKGATRLPGGDILVLESAKLDNKERIIRLVRLAASDIRPGAHLLGRELSRLKAPLIVSNFEATAAREGARGETLIYLLSDNDFDEDDRTLLLMFELAK
jgi:hypothetical protein